MPLKINKKQKTEDGNKLELAKVDLVFIFDIQQKLHYRMDYGTLTQWGAFRPSTASEEAKELFEPKKWEH